jgi:hypothetical protein
MGKQMSFVNRFFKSFSFRSCIFEDNLCNWSYGICSQMKLSQMNDEGDFCIKKKSYINCQCDRGYEMIKVTPILF